MYKIRFTEDAQKHLFILAKNSPQALKKLEKMLVELRVHPRTGTGQVEQLKHYEQETWSRRLTREHRLVYRIHDDIVEVLIISAFGHYK